MEEFLLQHFKAVTSVPYIQLEKHTASYYTEVTDGNTLQIYLECSNGTIDWLNNFDFPAKPYGEMENLWFVHKGFLRVWKTIRDEIKDQINNTNIKEIIIVGYSHGAALAALCHEYCVFRRPDIEDNIFGFGFGAPRVVWGFLNKTVKQRFRNFFVIRNCRDIVTHLPPAIFGYRHVGNMIKIGSGAHYGLIDSHRPESYIAELQEERQKDESN